MPRKYVKVKDRAVFDDDESIVIRYFMERPFSEATTALRFAGHVLRLRKNAQQITEAEPPSGTAVGQRVAPKVAAPRKRVKRGLPTQTALPPQYADDPGSIGEET